MMPPWSRGKSRKGCATRGGFGTGALGALAPPSVGGSLIGQAGIAGITSAPGSVLPGIIGNIIAPPDGVDP